VIELATRKPDETTSKLVRDSTGIALGKDSQRKAGSVQPPKGGNCQIAALFRCRPIIAASRGESGSRLEMGIHDAVGDTEQRRETRRLRVVVFDTLRPFPALWSLWRKRQMRSNGITA
jgi:hypothetical protein